MLFSHLQSAIHNGPPIRARSRFPTISRIQRGGGTVLSKVSACYRTMHAVRHNFHYHAMNQNVMQDE